MKRREVMTSLACVWLSWGCPAAQRTPPRHAGDLHVFAEGPCAALSIHAVGERRFVTYGDTGYDLHGWLPGDRVAAAQALVEVAGGRAFFNPAFSAGIPTDARGYARGALALGGDTTGAWLLLTTSRYARGGTGALFEREAEGFVFAGDGWKRSPEPVALPHGARDLPALPGDACGELVFVPLAWEATSGGGVVVGGRCDDERAQNPHDPILVVMHGAARARTWRVERLTETDALDGIVNLELAARGDDDVYLVAYEPFRPREARQSFIAHFDGSGWRPLDWAIEGGAMSIALTSDGGAHVAASRALYRRHANGRIERVKMPPLAFADVADDELHIHTVRSLDDELWAEASYRVDVPAEGNRRTSVWGSALYSRGPTPALYYCDARETAEDAFYEVSP